MALYFYFNETTGDLVYSDKAAYDVEGYVSLGQQTNMNPNSESEWVFDSKRSSIVTVSKDESTVGKIVGLTNMNIMFSGCGGLTSLDLSGFDTSAVTDMAAMFYNCRSITSLDLSSLDTSSVNNMTNMFNGCIGLTSLDISGLDTSNVTSMYSMFCGCGDLTSLDLSGLDTSSVKNMYSMFYGCVGLTSLDLSGFDTSAVTTMSNMFFGCSGLTSLDLSYFNTSAVTSMSSMFGDCSRLISLDLSGFDTSNVMSTNGMFVGCPALRIVDISPNMPKALLVLPSATYYDAVTRQSYAKADIPGGGTYVRDLADLDLVATMVQTRMGIDVAKRLAQRALRKVNVSSSGGTGGVDVPFSHGTVLIDGDPSKLFACTLSSDSDEKEPVLLFAEGLPDDLSSMAGFRASFGPNNVSVFYQASSGGNYLISQLGNGSLQVFALKENGSPINRPAYFGLTENAEQPMIGTNITPEGFIDPDYYLLASTDRYGLAKVDGTTIVSDDGVLSASIPDTSAFVTKTDADATYQPKGDYLTEIPAEYLTQTEGDAVYAAKTHTHQTADVTGLQVALDGKAAKSHTHTVSQITDFPEIPEAYAMATDAEASGLLGY